jgi:hypothetical protein
MIEAVTVEQRITAEIEARFAAVERRLDAGRAATTALPLRSRS